MLGAKTGFDISKAFSVGQLRKGHAKKLIETTEGLDLVVPIVSLDATSKGMHWKMFHYLGEDHLSYMHDLPLKAAQIPVF